MGSAPWRCGNFSNSPAWRVSSSLRLWKYLQIKVTSYLRLSCSLHSISFLLSFALPLPFIFDVFPRLHFLLPPLLSSNPIRNFTALFFTSKVLSWCHVLPPANSVSCPYFDISLVWIPEGRPEPRKCSMFLSIWLTAYWTTRVQFPAWIPESVSTSIYPPKAVSLARNMACE
jgi:hypothetical protein